MIENILGTFKIKYDIIMPQINEKIRSGSFINIYLDLNSLLDPLYSPNVVPVIERRDDKKFTVITSILSIIAHYRYLFYSRYKVHSKFILFYSFKRPFDGKTINERYCEDYDNKYSLSNPNLFTLNKFINSELDNLKTLIEYIPYAYLYNTEDFEPMGIVHHFVNKSFEDDVNLLISKDMYDFQFLKGNNTFLLYPKMEDTKLISSNELIDFVLERGKVSYRPEIDVDNSLYSLILSIMGISKRTLKGIKGYGIAKAIKLIEKKINSKEIPNQFFISEDMLIKLIDSNSSVVTIKNNLRTLDVELVYNRIKDLPSFNHMIENGLVDKTDIETFSKINEDCFNDNPININHLFMYRGNEVKRQINIDLF